MSARPGLRRVEALSNDPDELMVEGVTSTGLSGQVARDDARAEGSGGRCYPAIRSWLASIGLLARLVDRLRCVITIDFVAGPAAERDATRQYRHADQQRCDQLVAN